jgi:hypothetical protein
MDFKSTPKELLSAVQDILKEASVVRVSDLDSIDRRKYEKLKKDLKAGETIVIDINYGNFTKTKKVTDNHIPIREECDSDLEEKEDPFDQTDKHLKSEEEEEPKSDPSLSEVDVPDEDDVEQEAKRQAHAGDPQLGENFAASQEPNSAVGHRRHIELPKQIDVVDEMVHVGGVKQEGFRLLMQFPGGRSVFFPEANDPSAQSLDELATLVDILPPEAQEYALEAISRAAMRPHMRGIHKGNVALEESNKKKINEAPQDGRLSTPERARLVKGAQEISSGLNKIVDIVSERQELLDSPTFTKIFARKDSPFPSDEDPVDTADSVDKWVRDFVNVVRKL